MKREVKMVYPNGQVMFVQMTDAEIAQLVADRKTGCLLVKEFEILG